MVEPDNQHEPSSIESRTRPHGSTPRHRLQGFYKPDPRPYQLGLSEMAVDAPRCLFVTGSAYDLVGTASVGMPTYWHDRIGMTAPEGAPAPLAHEASLDRLTTFILDC